MHRDVSANHRTYSTRHTATQSLRLGFVPLADCAPLIVAQETGIFRRYDLRVTLHRELGWATIRDKIIHGELDAAHALAAMPVAATLGLGSIQCASLTALILNLNGNAITLANPLWKKGIHTVGQLREEIIRVRRHKTFTFGIVSSFSSHNYLLRTWLTSAGIHPDRDVRIVVVPPPQMVANLKAGHLDGFCVGEPWNSVAVQSKAGWCIATSAELQPNHPEKVLMVRREFAESRAEEHLAVVAALLEACEFCEAPENRDELVALLARPEYVAAPIEALRRGFDGHFDFGHDNVRTVRGFSVFRQPHANEPSMDKAAWVFGVVRASGLCPSSVALNAVLGNTVFRADLHQQAAAVCVSENTTNENEADSKIITV